MSKTFGKYTVLRFLSRARNNGIRHPDRRFVGIPSGKQAIAVWFKNKKADSVVRGSMHLIARHVIYPSHSLHATTVFASTKNYYSDAKMNTKNGDNSTKGKETRTEPKTTNET